MHNDDYSAWDFVVDILKQIFHKDGNAAQEIAGRIHKNGWGICGTYPYEIAEIKVAHVHSIAKKNGYPLRCSIQEE